MPCVIFPRVAGHVHQEFPNTWMTLEGSEASSWNWLKDAKFWATLSYSRPISILDGNSMKYPLKRVGRCPRLDFFHMLLESMIVAGSVVIFPFWLGDIHGIR